MEFESLIQILTALGVSPDTMHMIVTIAGLLVAVCAGVAAVWKPAPESRWYWLYKIINAAAFNFGKAKNATPPEPVKTDGVGKGS